MQPISKKVLQFSGMFPRHLVISFKSQNALRQLPVTKVLCAVCVKVKRATVKVFPVKSESQDRTNAVVYLVNQITKKKNCRRGRCIYITDDRSTKDATRRCDTSWSIEAIISKAINCWYFRELIVSAPVVQEMFDSLLRSIAIYFDSDLVTRHGNVSASKPKDTKYVISSTPLRGSFSLHCAPVHHALLLQLSAHTTV